jgi:hypothetical protein
MAIYAADFETTTNPEDCRVWAWCICDIYDIDNTLTYGNTIESFIEWLMKIHGKVYFHNLKFDGTFILDYLLKHNYTWFDKRKLSPGEFNTLISDMRQWYQIRLVPRRPSGLDDEVQIIDSLKILPMPISEMPKSFGIEEKKLELDYKADREIGHELTEHEKDYIAHDVIILAKALKFMYDHNQTKLTTGANALSDFIIRYGKQEYKNNFPELDPHTFQDFKRAYKGGFTFLNPAYKDKSVKEGAVFDVNSMYPWAMKNCLLPYGEPVYFPERYQNNPIYPLYIQCMLCEFKLKPNHYPCIQIKGHFMYHDTEYLTESVEPTYLYLTSVDEKLVFDHYDVNVIEWCGGYMLKGTHGIFNDYIDYWYNEKTEARIEGNPGRERIAKLMLNSLYGKFGAKQRGKSCIPCLKDDNKLGFYLSEEEQRKGGYIPIACFITAYCRDKIIRGAQICGDRFIYADTDSLHIAGTEPPPGLWVDNKALGAFKLEETFIRAKFIRQKTYLEVVLGKDYEEKINIKCAGMPKNVKATITEDKFHEGAVFDGKLLPKIVPGGVILRETTFEIKKAKSVDKYNT